MTGLTKLSEAMIIFFSKNNLGSIIKG
jgi:hypothetical protein